MTSNHLWCIHCERTYRSGEHRKIGTRVVCPYPDCSGIAAFAWEWPRVLHVNPDYPLDPVPGTCYPLFGKRVYSQRAEDRVRPRPSP